MSTTFKPVPNPITGKTDYNFSAKLVSLGTKVLQLNNAKKTEYVIGKVDFTYPDGTPAKGIDTTIFAKNLAHGIEVGSNLLSTLQVNDGKVYIRTSHLLAGNYADINAFGSLFADEAPAVEAKANAEVEAVN